MGAHTLPYLRKEFASTVGCVLGFLDGGAVAPGPGERGRPGRRRVRPTPDLERFQRPPAGFWPSPREARGGAPEAGALPGTYRGEVFREFTPLGYFGISQAGRPLSKNPKARSFWHDAHYSEFQLYKINK